MCVCVCVCVFDIWPRTFSEKLIPTDLDISNLICPKIGSWALLHSYPSQAATKPLCPSVFFRTAKATIPTQLISHNIGVTLSPYSLPLHPWGSPVSSISSLYSDMCPPSPANSLTPAAIICYLDCCNILLGTFSAPNSCPVPLSTLDTAAWMIKDFKILKESMSRPSLKHSLPRLWGSSGKSSGWHPHGNACSGPGHLCQLTWQHPPQFILCSSNIWPLFRSLLSKPGSLPTWGLWTCRYFIWNALFPTPLHTVSSAPNSFRHHLSLRFQRGLSCPSPRRQSIWALFPWLSHSVCFFLLQSTHRQLSLFIYSGIHRWVYVSVPEHSPCLFCLPRIQHNWHACSKFPINTHWIDESFN